MEIKENSAFKLFRHTKFRQEHDITNLIDDQISFDSDHEDENQPFNIIDFGIHKKFEIHGCIRKNNPVTLLTEKILKFYKSCSSNYSYEESMKPKRDLTIPNEGRKIFNVGVLNDGADNIENDLIVKVSDEIQCQDVKYKLIDLIGKGVSGQVFECVRNSDQKVFAIKIIKNKVAYTTQALLELKILDFLNNQVDPKDEHHIIRKHDYFYYKKHTCIVFELLNENLLDLLRKNNFGGLSLKTIRFIIKDILEAVYQLQKTNIIHTDIKPENVLLKIVRENHKSEIIVKLTDFGSACYKNNTFYKYIQSRYYRAPEVLIGTQYSLPIDLWSVGCIAAELFIGTPLFAGVCEFDQLLQIVKFFKEIPYYFIKGDKAKKYLFFEERGFKFKAEEEYYKEFPNDYMKQDYHHPLKSFDIKSFKEVLRKHKDDEKDLESFINLLKGLLVLDPQTRWNAKMALRHPFITRERFEGILTIIKGNFSPYWAETSIINTSLDGSMFSEKSRAFNSINVSYNHYDYLNKSTCSNQEVSFDFNNNFRPILENIPMRILKDCVPQAKLFNLNQNQKKNINKFDNPGHNSFMASSFEKLDNNSREYKHFNTNNKFKHCNSNGMGINTNNNKNNKNKKYNQAKYNQQYNSNNSNSYSTMNLGTKTRTSNDYMKPSIFPDDLNYSKEIVGGHRLRSNSDKYTNSDSYHFNNSHFKVEAASNNSHSNFMENEPTPNSNNLILDEKAIHNTNSMLNDTFTSEEIFN